MIKAICFDLDGVYFTSAGFSSFKQAIMDLGVSKKDTDHILHGSPMSEFKTGKIIEKEYWRNVVEYWKIDKTPSELIEMLPKGYEIDPDVHQTVLTARKNGYKTCICSNNFSTRIDGLEKKFGFLEHFDASVFSYEIGIMKPDKRIFQKLVKRVGVEPDELVYSDDNDDKLGGARELGIKAFVYEDFEQFMKELRNLGVKI